MEQQKNGTNHEKEYAPNGKPIAYELYGDDAGWHLMYKIGIWIIIIFSLFSLFLFGLTGDWEALIFNIFGLIIGVPSIISGKSKCSVVYRLTEEKKQKRKTTIIFLVIFFIIMIIYALISGGPSDKSVKHNTNKNSNGVKYNENDSYYSNYDYDDDGAINQKEWEDALGDRMDEIMGY